MDAARRSADSASGFAPRTFLDRRALDAEVAGADWDELTGRLCLVKLEPWPMQTDP